MIDTGISIQSYDAWNELRHQDITSSNCSSLFGLNQYPNGSYFALWHQKKASTPPNFEANEAMEWGNVLQAPIAYQLAKKNGLEIVERSTYCRHDTLKMGSSFDYEIVGTTPDSPYRADFEKYGNGIFEIKNVHFMAHKGSWKQEEGNDLSPYVECQVQHQLLVSGLKWGIVGALIGGNQGQVVKVLPDKDAQQAIEQAVIRFWASIEANQEPQPDYRVDGDLILARFTPPIDKEDVFLEDPVIESMVSKHIALNKAEKEASAEKEALKVQIVEYLGGIKKAKGLDWSVTCSHIAETPDSVITEDMVGQVVKGRKSSLRVLIKGK